MNVIHLRGLEGTNPLGFLAALGVQVAFANNREQPRLWWSEDITPHAITNREFPVDRIAAQALEVFAHWKRQLCPQSEAGGRVANAEGRHAEAPQRGHQSVSRSGKPLRLERELGDSASGRGEFR